jgi:hypothetical protein
MIKFIIRIFLLSGILLCPPPLPAAEPFDLPQFIQKELSAGKKTITIPPGRYRVTPQGKEHVRLSGLRDVTIEATGVELVCTETTRAVTVLNCTNLIIRGLSIDYDPLPFTQGRITSVSEDRRVYEVELFDGYPPPEKIITPKYEVFEPDGIAFRHDEYAPFQVEPASGRTLRLIKSRVLKTGGQVGDIIIFDTEDALGGSHPHAVYIENSKEIRFEKVVLYASNCFGFLEVGCDRTVYQDCAVRRRRPESDPVRRGHFRVRSLNADAFHSKAALHGPQIIGCSAEYQADDAVNITGSYHLISGTEDGRLTVLAHRIMDIQAGDRVELVDRNGRSLPDAKVVSIRRDGPTSPEEIKLVQSLPILQSVRDLLKQRYIVELDRSVSVEPGAIICSRDRVGDHFKIINCHFSRNRSRGILVKASGGEIRDTVIEHCGMTAFLIAPSYEWLEAGFVHGLTVENCTVTDSGGPAVEIHGIGKFLGHSRLNFSRNLFITDAIPAVSIDAVESAVFEQNTLNGQPLPESSLAVKIRNSESVLIKPENR